MTVEEIFALVRKMKIDDDEDDYVFKAAVILLYGITHETIRVINIKRATGFYMKDVDLIIYNFKANGIIQNCSYCLENLDGSDLELTIEITLCAMCGSGDIIRTDASGKHFDEYNQPISRQQLIYTGRSKKEKLLAV